MQHPAEWLDHSMALQPRLLSPSSFVSVPLAARPLTCKVQQFHSHPTTLQQYKHLWPALGTAVILVNPSTLTSQQMLKRLQLNGATECCLQILGFPLHYLQLQLTIVKCSYEGFLAYVANQRRLSRWLC